jgi:hypothetical protein
MQLNEKDKKEIREKISNRARNNVIFGNFEQFPPYGEWFVTLYFQGNFSFENRYNTDIGYDFLISQVVSGISENETMVSIKIVESDN